MELKSVFVESFLVQAGLIMEFMGVAVIIGGAMLATLYFFMCWFNSRKFIESFNDYRQNIGRGILLGLELLVAADIIGTVLIEPTMENVLVLGLIVIIRTFLSYSLEVEIHGRWPWKRHEKK